MNSSVGAPCDAGRWVVIPLQCFSGACLTTPSSSGSLPPMQIGIFTKTFMRPALGLVLDAVQSTGLNMVQFNMESAGLPPMPDEIPAEIADGIRAETAARGLKIASVQGTFNMSHPDPEYRRTG